jgi:hypothetical protein
MIPVTVCRFDIGKPSLSRVRRQAKSTLCKNNLRQMGLATTLYAQDNGDRLPYAWGVRRTCSLFRKEIIIEARPERYSWPELWLYDTS